MTVILNMFIIVHNACSIHANMVHIVREPLSLTLFFIRKIFRLFNPRDKLLQDIAYALKCNQISTQQYVELVNMLQISKVRLHDIKIIRRKLNENINHD